jgi:hypothetical protein
MKVHEIINSTVATGIAFHVGNREIIFQTLITCYAKPDMVIPVFTDLSQG